MQEKIPENLKKLAATCPLPLYLVGGSVRDFLAGYPITDKTDWDICSPMAEEVLTAAAERCGIHVCAVYKHTGTVKLDDGIHGYEFTRFRSDRYVRGVHTPSEIQFTDDISLDALRRDFRANAVYYDIAAGTFCDPLGGIPDIHARILRTVRDPKRVFGEDGLRLLRLARQTAELGFTPDEACLNGARENAAFIRDISSERIYAELRLLLTSDAKHGDALAPYRGLCVLRDTTVLGHTMPELALGENMSQRNDFHDFDVLEHSFRCVRYAPPSIRWAALLHDVGKPFCMQRDGNFYAHAEEGARIAGNILHRLRAPRLLTKETVFLVKMHMRDFDCKMRENKVRREIRDAGHMLEALLALKQADFSACKGDVSQAPAVAKWRQIEQKMRKEGVPFSLKDLKIGGYEVQALGVPLVQTAQILTQLLDDCLFDGTRNNPDWLAARTRALIAK